MSKIELQLTADQIDVILTALGEQPFVKVHELINEIRKQAIPQWQALNNVEVTGDLPQKGE